MTENPIQADSLLPYTRWAEEAMRAVAVEALAHVAAHGLPGEHHFYITFRTDHPGVVIPGHLKARFPEEMTIVLQHRFWDLTMDRAKGSFSVGLSFGGAASMLTVPIAALTAFVDPSIRFGLSFPGPEVAATPPAPEADAPAEPTAEAPAPQVVSLDAFRRRPTRD